jgi:hypothetical protein
MCSSSLRDLFASYFFSKGKNLHVGRSVHFEPGSGNIEANQGRKAAAAVVVSWHARRMVAEGRGRGKTR